MKIVITALPYTFTQEFGFPITVEATQRDDGLYLVTGRAFLGQRFRFKQVLDTSFLNYKWAVHPKFVTEEVSDDV